VRGSFTSPQEVRQAIDAFVTVYSENARPSEWRKAEARQTTPQQKYADAPPRPPPYVHLAACP